MAKINRERVIAEALALLDEVGLDGMSTRRLAQRLGVEQPSLYWHFKGKDALLTAMAEEAMAPHVATPPPSPDDDWREWFLENYRSFRRTLLLHRDGARLHAGTFPSGGALDVLLRKIAFMTVNGIPEEHVQMAMMAAGQLTVGSALEEQAASTGPLPPSPLPSDHARGFEAGLRLLVDGLARHQVHVGAVPSTPGPTQALADT